MSFILRRKDFKKYDIFITDHAFNRWNERVSKVNDKKQIVEFIRNASKEKGGIAHKWVDFYIVNDVLIVINVSNVIRIITVYGKISENPHLNRINYLMKYRSRNNKNMRINLRKDVVVYGRNK